MTAAAVACLLEDFLRTPEYALETGDRLKIEELHRKDILKKE
jgi:hypothetical protein